MLTHTSRDRPVAILTALAVAAGALLLPSTAVAAEGSAPPPKEFRVIANVHTDAVSTFLDEGRLALASRADVPEGHGTRFAAADIWFHLEDAARGTVPAEYEFIAPVGSTVWTAPESNPGSGRLWPGFNTESVAPGAIDDDRTTFTLTNFDGPGDLEVFTGGGFGAAKRLWSSRDSSIRTFDIGRGHMHANWAFTAAGTYRLGVESTVTVAGVSQSATATYTFVVGELPEQRATVTTLSASSSTVALGEAVTLSARLSPPDVQGHVEFRDGATVLGHEALVTGEAQLTVSNLSIGAHSITAHFVPAVLNLAAPSGSAGVAVTVTDAAGAEFSVEGVAASYQPGDTLSARVTGVTLGESQAFRWHLRPIGSTEAGVTVQTGTQTDYTTTITAAESGFELSVSLRNCSNASCSSGTVAAQTAWVPLTVVNTAAAPSIARVGETATVYTGDRAEVTWASAPLAGGDTLRWAYRTTGTAWRALPASYDAVELAENRMGFGLRIGATITIQYALQVVRDGIPIAQSDAVHVDYAGREVHFDGLRPLYRQGTTMQVTPRLYPAVEGLTYRWTRREAADPSEVTIQESPEPLLEWPLTMADDGTQFRVYGMKDGVDYTPPVGGFFRPMVSDLPADQTLVVLDALSSHYHQGDTIRLNLRIDPAPSDGDRVEWEWRWPGTDWAPLPGVEGVSGSLIAEQAMHGVEIRATLDFAEEGADSITVGPATIGVDDHGAAARQSVAITGERVMAGAAAFEAGEAGTFTAVLGAASILGTYQWFLKPPGATEAAPIIGATGATYDFTAASDHDGAEATVAVVKPDGTVAYGPSTPVTLRVADAGENPPSGKPDHAPAARTGADLADTPEGGIELAASTVAPGDFLVADLGSEHAGDWVAAWLFSAPRLLGGDWTQASGTGSITLHIPSNSDLGAHRLAVFAADGSLMGWASVTVVQESDPATGGPGTRDPGTGGSATSDPRDVDLVGTVAAGSASGSLAATGSPLPFAALAFAVMLTVAGVLLASSPRKRRGMAE